MTTLPNPRPSSPASDFFVCVFAVQVDPIILASIGCFALCFGTVEKVESLVDFFVKR